MANRFYTRESFQMEKNVVRLYAQLTFGAAGAVTLVPLNSKGVLSAVKSATGKYTLVFGTKASSLDLYYRLLMVKHTWDATKNSGTAPASPLMYLIGNSVATNGTCSLEIEFTNLSSTATAPASGEQVFIEFDLSNSGSY